MAASSFSSWLYVYCRKIKRNEKRVSRWYGWWWRWSLCQKISKKCNFGLALKYQSAFLSSLDSGEHGCCTNRLLSIQLRVIFVEQKHSRSYYIMRSLNLSIDAYCFCCFLHGVWVHANLILFLLNDPHQHYHCCWCWWRCNYIPFFHQYLLIYFPIFVSK